MTEKELIERYLSVEDRIAGACMRAGRSRDSVQLLAVSKFQPESAIKTLAFGAGQTLFGENYVQEALEKRQHLAGLQPSISWHMIGHVQSRKAPLITGKFELVHTLDSLKLASGLERQLQEQDRMQDVLIEVNIGLEPQKSGVMPEELNDFAIQLKEQAPHLRLRGLMGMPPYFEAGEAARPYFIQLRRLRDGLEQAMGLRLPELSMGMSGDFEEAIEEGSTFVRVGSAIFGPRPVKS